MNKANDKLAIYGGKKVNRLPFPNWPQFDKNDESIIKDALYTGYWNNDYSSSYVNLFEKSISKHLNSHYVISVSNGTNALEIALEALNISSNNEVIVPAYSFASTVTSVIRSGATPVFADIDLDSWNISPVSIEKCITPKTKAIIIVHFGGLPCDMEKIYNITNKYKLNIIEDAAQAYGAIWNKKKVGTLGDIGCFSMQTSKNLTCGEGGFLTTNSDDYNKRILLIKNIGRKDNLGYEHYLAGSNYRLSELQAALAYSQLSKYEYYNNIRKKNVKFLDKQITTIEGLAARDSLDVPFESSNSMYGFRFIEKNWNRIDRKRFVYLMNSEGIPCSVGYPKPLYSYRMFQNNKNYKKDVCLNSELLCRQSVWLHNNVLIGSTEQTQNIIKAIKKIRNYY